MAQLADGRIVPDWAHDANAASHKVANKVQRAMHEFKHGELHSGSKHGPKVTDRKQAIAIALSEQRKANKGGY